MQFKDSWTEAEIRARGQGSQMMTNHLYMNPGHEVQVTNTGMPAEFIIAICQTEGCRWETQW